MSTTITTPVKTDALAPKKSLTIQEMIQKSTEQLKLALPAHMRPERIVRIALTTLRLNPKLYECDPHSFIAALFQSAQLGLEPNLNGESWLIPYRVKGKPMVQFQVGAYGLVKLFWNHQNAVSLQVEKVCQNDDFTYDLGSCELHHKLPQFGMTRGETVGYYAYAQLANGGRQLKVISKEEAVEFAKKFSKCFDKEKKSFIDGTPWNSHFDEMAKKTVLKQLMKLLPKSIELQHALAMDETVKTKVDADMISVPDETDYSTVESDTDPSAAESSKE